MAQNYDYDYDDCDEDRRLIASVLFPVPTRAQNMSLMLNLVCT